MIKVSVVIPTYNGAEKILNCLRALENQSYQEFQTVVVIDGSTDNTEKVIAQCSFCLDELTVHKQSNKGRSSVRNTGVSIANGNLIIFLDDDMRPTPDFILNHLNFHKENNGCILQGNQLEDLTLAKTDFQKFKAFLSRKWMSGIGIVLTKINSPFLTASNFSVEKKVFLNLGGFDELLRDAEDYDLAVRAFESGVPIYFDPELVAWHDDFITCSSYINRSKQYKAAHERLVNLYPERHAILKKQNEVFLNRIKFSPFKGKFWINLIDKEHRLLKIMPEKVRFKLYDLVVTANLN